MSSLFEGNSEQRIAPPGVEVPLPPSANHLWFIVGRRQVKSAMYKSWLKEAVPAVSLIPIHHNTPCQVTITIVEGKGFMTSRDLDNCAKACIDALKPEVRDKYGKLISPGAAIILDDNVRHVRRMVLQVLPAHDKKSAAECWVDVKPIAEGSWRDWIGAANDGR